MLEIRYIQIAGKYLKLIRRYDGLWQDTLGTIWALTDDKFSVDPTSRCGIGIFSLPVDHPLNIGCRTHEFFYSSPAWQTFNTRQKSDEWLLRDIQNTSRGKWYSILAKPFYWLSRLRGGAYWEIDKTR